MGESTGLVFGVYPFGTTGGPRGIVSGPPDDIGPVGQALAELAGDGPPLLVRVYVSYTGDVDAALDLVSQLASIGGLVDLSLNFHDEAGDVDRWCTFVDAVVRRHGSQVGSIGVTNEANLQGVPFAPDGAYPHALQALVDGLLAAAEAKLGSGATAAIGFAAAADGAATDFWPGVGRGGVAEVAEFAGLTLYPAGFGASVPPPAEIVRETTEMLTRFRAQLTSAGIGAPIRITECGWPTGPGRSEDDQVEILRTVLDAVMSLRAELNVTHWSLFTLRDADSTGDDVFGRFGVLHDDYTPKPAFAMLRDLIRGGATG